MKEVKTRKMMKKMAREKGIGSPIKSQEEIKKRCLEDENISETELLTFKKSKISGKEEVLLQNEELAEFVLQPRQEP